MSTQALANLRCEASTDADVETQTWAPPLDASDRHVGVTVRTWSGGPAPDWAEPTLRQFTELLSLGDGWDSYGAPAPTPGVVMSGLMFLARVMPDDAVPPSVVPTVRGTVMLTWCRAGFELDIECGATGAMSAFVDEPDGADREVPLDERSLRAVVRRVAVPA